MTYRSPGASGSSDQPTTCEAASVQACDRRRGGDSTGYRSRYEGRINVSEAAYFAATPRADITTAKPCSFEFE